MEKDVKIKKRTFVSPERVPSTLVNQELCTCVQHTGYPETTNATDNNKRG